MARRSEVCRSWAPNQNPSCTPFWDIHNSQNMSNDQLKATRNFGISPNYNCQKLEQLQCPAWIRNQKRPEDEVDEGRNRCFLQVFLSSCLMIKDILGGKKIRLGLRCLKPKSQPPNSGEGNIQNLFNIAHDES